jgi:hypothetical protein
MTRKQYYIQEQVEQGSDGESKFIAWRERVVRQTGMQRTHFDQWANGEMEPSDYAAIALRDSQTKEEQERTKATLASFIAKNK